MHPKPLEPYKYWDRVVSYRSEKLEISKEELKKINKINKTSIEVKPFPSPQKPVKVIIDTDIGTDFDDTMALLYALHLPDLEILGLTTNYGIPGLRAGVARKITDAYHMCHPEKPQFPIVIGASLQLGTHRPIFLCGNEGHPFFNDDEVGDSFNASKWGDLIQTDAADFIVSVCKQFPGEITIVSIGIPTNIALAFKRNPEVKSLIKEIIVMGGGSFIREGNCESPFPLPKKDDDIVEWVKEGKIIHCFPNHNLSGDTMASKVMFDSGVKLKIIPHDVTKNFWVQGAPIEFLRERANNVKDVRNPTDPAGAAGLIMLEWFKRRRGQNGQCPHDPLTIHEALYGDDDSPLLYAQGIMILHEWAAFGTFIPHNDGNHFLAIQTRNVDKFIEKLGETLMINDLPE